MVGIDIGKFTGRILQVLQQLNSLEHLLDGIGAQKVVIDAVQFIGIRPGIAPGPFLGIAHRTHAAQVHAGHQIGGILLFDQNSGLLIASGRISIQ